MAQTRDETKRTAIRDAVISDVVENGVGNAPMSQIAKKAGVSAGTIYIYYPNKDEMLQLIFLEVKTQLHAVMMEAWHEGSDIADSIRRMWLSMFAFMINHPQMFAFHEALSAEKLLTTKQHESVLAMAKDIHDILNEAIEEGVLRNMPMDCLISLLIAPAATLARRILAAGETDLAKGEVVFAAIWEGIRA